MIPDETKYNSEGDDNDADDTYCVRERYPGITN